MIANRSLQQAKRVHRCPTLHNSDCIATQLTNMANAHLAYTTTTHTSDCIATPHHEIASASLTMMG